MSSRAAPIRRPMTSARSSPTFARPAASSTRMEDASSRQRRAQRPQPAAPARPSSAARHLDDRDAHNASEVAWTRGSTGPIPALDLPLRHSGRHPREHSHLAISALSDSDRHSDRSPDHPRDPRRLEAPGDTDSVLSSERADLSHSEHACLRASSSLVKWPSRPGVRPSTELASPPSSEARHA